MNILKKIHAFILRKIILKNTDDVRSVKMGSKNTIMVIPKDVDMPLGKYFNSSEFKCKCSYKSCTKTLIDIEHLDQLIALREEIGPIKITSGFRCKKHNKDVGGIPTSQHTKGTATDIQSSRLKARLLADLIDEGYTFNGVGSYDTFTHIDSRANKIARWRF